MNSFITIKVNPPHTKQYLRFSIGYADEEDRHHQQAENAAAASSLSTNDLHPPNDDESPTSPTLSTDPNFPTANNLTDPHSTGTVPTGSSRTGINRARHASNNISLSLVNPHALMSEIDENLAADFDGSFSGLGIDINATSYSMSEALLALPNLSISSTQMFKQEAMSPKPAGIGKESSGPILYFKEEPNSVNQSPILMVANKNSGGKIGGSRVTTKRHQKVASAAAKNLEALDLSNDEAHLPETSGNHVQDGRMESSTAQKISFIGSVSRESSCEGGTGNNLTGNQHLYHTNKTLLNLQQSNNAQSSSSNNYNNIANLSGSHPNLSLAGASVPAIAPASHEENINKKQTVYDATVHRLVDVKHSQIPTVKAHKVILPLQSSTESLPVPHTDLTAIASSSSPVTGTNSSGKIISQSSRTNAKRTNVEPSHNNETHDFSLHGILAGGNGIGLDDPNETFQYILAAATSNATKLNEPSITYLNQGQAYELRLKKLGDLSPYRGSKNRLLKCKVRICFHERRLQYMELEQLAEWSLKHQNERVLELDVPLRYTLLKVLPYNYSGT